MLKITLLGADPAVETEMRIRFPKLYCQQLDTLTPDDVSAHADASQCDVVLTVVPHVSRIVRETLSALRARKFTTPIVGLLSAHTRTWDADRASFLNAGGDDLLALPCDLDNLEATSRAVTRRKLGEVLGVKSLNVAGVNISIDTRSRTVYVDGSTVNLSAKEFDLLDYLAGRPGTIISKEMILNRLYSGIDEPDFCIIATFVARLRKKLSKKCQVKIIETIHGYGYILRPDKVSRTTAVTAH